MKIAQTLYYSSLLSGTVRCQTIQSSQPWGTTQVSELPRFLSSSTRPGASLWGDVKPGQGFPSSGVVRRYEFSVTRETFAPDGVDKSSLLINGQFPGPLLEANWGDTFQITVHNRIENQTEGLTLHWHGQSQKKSPVFDGVPGVSQCPIAPGTSFTYSFIAEDFGSSWYHSHVSQQYLDGLWGPMVVYGPVQPEAIYDIDIGPVMLSDWTHQSYYTWLKEDYTVPFKLPSIDNNFINGRGTYDCQTSSKQSNCTSLSHVSRFRFHPGKTHRLRLINASGYSTQKFTIDGYKMIVFANDYTPIQPYTTDVITLGVGQRTDILVKVPSSARDPVWMRSEVDSSIPCNGAIVNNGNAKAIIAFNDSTGVVPRTNATSWQSNDCTNDPLDVTIPYWPVRPPVQPATTIEANITLIVNGTGFTQFAINNSSFVTNYNHPVLLLEDLGNTSYPLDPQWNVYNFGSNNSIRIVLHNYFPGSHPMHLHGHNPWVISEGPGLYDGTSVQGDPLNPQRRDTAIMRPASLDGTPSHLVLEFQADNPGVWPLHCHIATHAATGLFMLVMERPDKLRDSAKSIPHDIMQTCTDWEAFSEVPGSVDQIDSGL